jgi:hypothetical protein
MVLHTGKRVCGERCHVQCDRKRRDSVLTCMSCPCYQVKAAHTRFSGLDKRGTLGQASYLGTACYGISETCDVEPAEMVTVNGGGENARKKARNVEIGVVQTAPEMKKETRQAHLKL